MLGMEEAPRAEPAWVSGSPVLVIDIVIDRDQRGATAETGPASTAAGGMSIPSIYSDFVESCLERHSGGPIQVDAETDKLNLLEAVARRIWESDFESYSRFVGPKWVYKTGDETVRNIIGGGGGICSEKVQALKFLTDNYGLEYCRGTPTPGVTGSAGFSSSESSGTVRAPCPSISLQAILNSGCRSLHTSRYSLPSCS